LVKTRIITCWVTLILITLLSWPGITVHAQDTDTIPSRVSIDTSKTPLLNQDSIDMLSQMSDMNQQVQQFSEGQTANQPGSQVAAPPGEAVEYGSKDSSYTDLTHQLVHLYGEAYVRYGEFNITADYIVLNLLTNQVEATSRPQKNVKALFKSGDQEVSAERIKYNINTEQGITHNARIQQSNLYIHGAISKFKKAGSDALHIDDVIYNKNTLITTCDLDHPHWGIRTSKFKMIPDKLAVIGPMDMELAGIPTPLAFPFAFAPLFSFGQAASGLIFPQDPIQNDPQLGLGMRGIGYHLAISDKLNQTFTGDIYTRGSWKLRSQTNYKKRYKYQGSVDLSFSHQLLETANEIEPRAQDAYSINITHRQDSKAHPYRTIGGTLNFTVNDFDRRNYNDAQSQINSQIRSNFNYAYKFTPKLNFSAGISHSQNTQTRNITFNLPNIQLRMAKFFPFKKKNSSASNEKWFEKVNVQYNSQVRNSVTTKDSTLFSSETLDKIRSGMTHNLDIGASYKMFKYFSFNTNIDYDEFWYLQTRNIEGVSDTTNSPLEPEDVDPITDIVGGFQSIRNLNLRAGINTNVFGTIQFAKGWLRGIRHRITPSVSLSYRPSTEGNYKYYDEDPLDPLNELTRYNPFEAGAGERLYTSTRLQQGGASINYSLDNVFEGKYWSKKDSMEKKFKIFDRIGINGGYDFDRDSLNFRDISFAANASFFDRKTSLSISGTLTPFVTVNQTKVNRLLISEGEGLLDLNTFALTLTTTITLKEIRDLIQGFGQEELGEGDGDSPQDQVNRRVANSRKRKVRKPGELPELFSWFEGVSFSHNLRYSLRAPTADRDGDKTIQNTAHTLQVRTGKIPLSDKWSVSLNNIAYDFRRKQVVYPSISISRKLHCWEMRASWQPQSDTYSFFIGVSASPFNQYLKYQTGRQQFSQFR